MAKNQSEYYIHELKDGELHSFGPGEDLPSWVQVTNPLVKGKAESDEDDADDDGEATPRRGRTRKAADS